MNLSVIIPVFNGASTIERCIKSICQQSFCDLEIIVVNDGSTDNTQLIIENLKRSDDRIKIINIKNGGVSHARNIGIQHAKGDNITFVDADDYIDKEMYTHLLKCMQDHKAGIVHCSYKNIYSDNHVVPVGNTGRVFEQSHDEALECLISGKLFTGSTCSKIFQRELFNNVRYDEKLKINEDILVCFQLFDKVEKSVYVDIAYYNYTSNEESSTHRTSDIVMHKQSLEVSERIRDYSLGKPYYSRAEGKVAYFTLVFYRTSLISGIKKEQLQALRESIIKYKPYYNTRNNRINCFLALYFPRILVWTYKIYDRIRLKKLDPEQ